MDGQRRLLLCVVAVGLVVMTACGTRLPDEAFTNSTRTAEVASGSAGAAAGSGTSAAGSGSAGSAAGSAAGAAAGTGGTTAGGGGAAAGGATGTAAAGSDGAAAAGPAGPNQASDVGITETTIRVGAIVAENGVLGDAFAPVVRGVRAWVEQVNAEGGINGRLLELFTCDDREDRARALECARRLVEQDQVFALVATNTRALGGAAPYLAEQGLPVLGIPITSSFYRWNNFFSLYGAGYPRDGNQVGHQEQLRSLSGTYRWFRENLGVTRAAVFAYDIAESSQAGSFMVEGLEREGFTADLYTVSFAAPSFDQAVAEMQRNGTTLVFDAMDDGANRRLCDTIERRGLQLDGKVSTIVAMGQSLGEEFAEACRNVTYITGSSVPYTLTEVPAVARFRSAFDRYQRGQELHQWAFEGFLLGELFASVVGPMGPVPTRQGFLDALNGRDGPIVLLDALINGDYQPADFAAPTAEHCFGIARWQDSAGGWTSATSAFPFCYPDAQVYYTPVSERGD